MTYEDICNAMRPADYVAGRGLSEAGAKVAHLLEEADLAATVDDPAADYGWGHLTPRALAEDEAQWQHMMHEGKL